MKARVMHVSFLADEDGQKDECIEWCGKWGLMKDPNLCIIEI